MSLSHIYKIYINPNIHTELTTISFASNSSGDMFKVVDDTLLFRVETRLDAIMYSDGEYKSIEQLENQITNWNNIVSITVFKSSSGRIYFVGIDNTNFVLYIYEFNQETSSFELCLGAGAVLLPSHDTRDFFVFCSNGSSSVIP